MWSMDPTMILHLLFRIKTLGRDPPTTLTCQGSYTHIMSHAFDSVFCSSSPRRAKGNAVPTEGLGHHLWILSPLPPCLAGSSTAP